jgi:ferredoxin
MAKVIIDGIEKEVEDNSPIKESCKSLDVPFGCEHGVCGTCQIIVSEGMQNLEEKNDKEIEMGLKENVRLACQCIIKQGEVKVSLM